LAQQQFGNQCRNSHQAGAGIFAGPDEITDRFDIAFGHGDRGDLTQAQQPGQLCAVAGVGVGPIPARLTSFDGAATTH
jgi:hypothetical protein